MMMYELKKIEFDEIISIWQDELWPNRISAIETHSTMVYPNNPKEKFNMDIFDFPVIFLWSLPQKTNSWCKFWPS